MGRNRYGFKGTSRTSIFGGTLGLELSTGLGRKMSVKNLSEPIRLVIPNKTPVPEGKSYVGYCTLMKNIHLIVNDVNESVIILKVSHQDT